MAGSAAHPSGLEVYCWQNLCNPPLTLVCRSLYSPLVLLSEYRIVFVLFFFFLSFYFCSISRNLTKTRCSRPTAFATLDYLQWAEVPRSNPFVRVFVRAKCGRCPFVRLCLEVPQSCPCPRRFVFPCREVQWSWSLVCVPSYDEFALSSVYSSVSAEKYSGVARSSVRPSMPSRFLRDKWRDSCQTLNKIIFPEILSKNKN